MKKGLRTTGLVGAACLALVLWPGDGENDRPGSGWQLTAFPGPATAFADDNGDGGDNGDNGDDGDDGDDDGGGFGGGGAIGGGGFGGGGGGNRARTGSGGANPLMRIFRPQRRAAPRTENRRPARRQRRAAQPAPPAPPPLPAAIDDEIVALDIPDTALPGLAAAGYAVIERVALVAIGETITRLSIPDGVTLEGARTAVEGLAPTATVDFNHLYAPESSVDDEEACEGLACPALDLIGWPLPATVRGTCGEGLTIGMVDTGINPEHAGLENAEIDLLSIPGTRPAPSNKRHGTAVAALLVGSSDPRIQGLIRKARLLAVDAFLTDGAGRTRSEAFLVVLALDRLAEEEPSVVNLSLAGPANTLLESAVQDLTERDIVLVAAVGNDGPAAEPRYPAAYPNVVGVTAVDANANIWRRAGRGEHVDFAAPGVNVWTATSVRGARARTGTSFATPFVTATIAVARDGATDATPADVIADLEARARDLGNEGRDEVFGAGLVDATGICPVIGE